MTKRVVIHKIKEAGEMPRENFKAAQRLYAEWVVKRYEANKAQPKKRREK